MSISETRKAIRGIASNYGEDRIWASTQVCTFADLKELEAAYTKLEKLAKDVVKDFNASPDYWSESCDRLGAFLVSREDPERVELASAPSGGELSGR